MLFRSVFVFPSFFEGLALVQLEALASGLPVIGTRSSGATDIVEPGETGLILTSGSVNELSDCLGQMTDIDKVRKMRNHCIQTRGGRSWKTYGERWMQLLNSIASDNVDPKVQQ